MPAAFPAVSSSVVVLEIASLRAWAYNREPPRLMFGPVRVSGSWRNLVDAFNFLPLAGRPGEAYFIWELDDRAKFRNALVSLNAPTSLITFINNRIQRNIMPQQIVVCWVDAQPFGDYFANMINRSDRITCLIVMLYGHRNANPCDHCAKRYASYMCRGRTDNGFATHVNWPFFECISHPDISSGKCANCIYHVQSDCDYNCNHGDNRSFSCVQQNAAKRDRSPNMGRRKFAGGPVEDAIEWEDAYDEVKEQNRSLEAACR